MGAQNDNNNQEGDNEIFENQNIVSLKLRE